MQDYNWLDFNIAYNCLYSGLYTLKIYEEGPHQLLRIS